MIRTTFAALAVLLLATPASAQPLSAGPCTDPGGTGGQTIIDQGAFTHCFLGAVSTLPSPHSGDGSTSVFWSARYRPDHVSVLIDYPYFPFGFGFGTSRTQESLVVAPYAGFPAYTREARALAFADTPYSGYDDNIWRMDVWPTFASAGRTPHVRMVVTFNDGIYEGQSGSILGDYAAYKQARTNPLRQEVVDFVDNLENADYLTSDGISDASDNCTAIVNATQLDVDGDGYGNYCDCDFNNSGGCDGTDFAAFAGALGTCGVSIYDMNGSGCVDGTDFGFFAGGFGGPPGPSGLVTP